MEVIAKFVVLSLILTFHADDKHCCSADGVTVINMFCLI